MIGITFSPRTQDAEAGRLNTGDQPGPHSETILSFSLERSLCKWAGEVGKVFSVLQRTCTMESKLGRDTGRVPALISFPHRGRNLGYIFVGVLCKYSATKPCSQSLKLLE